MFYTVIRTIILHIKVQYFSKYRDARFIDVKQKYTTRVLYYGSVVYNKKPPKISFYSVHFLFLKAKKVSIKLEWESNPSLQRCGRHSTATFVYITYC